MDELKKSYLYSDIRTVIVLVVFFVIITMALYVLSIKTDYLSSLASFLMTGVR